MQQAAQTPQADKDDDHDSDKPRTVSPAVLQGLTEAMKDSDADVRKQALEALTRLRVPIAFDASALGEVERIVVAVDRNPIRPVLAFEPLRVRPSLSFRFKLEQASPVRVAARTRDGTWHVGSTWVDAGGGGCTVPGATRRDGSWSRTLNRVEARVFPGLGQGEGQGQAGARVRLRVMHPMDTGLVAGIPAFHLETLVLADAARQPLLRLSLHEPVAENPIFSFDLREAVVPGMTVAGHDNNGNRIAARVSP